MIVIPSGSDANVRHQPFATLALVAICAVVSLMVWARHPYAVVYGPPAIAADLLDDRYAEVFEQPFDQAEDLVKEHYGAEAADQMLEGVEPGEVEETDQAAAIDTWVAGFRQRYGLDLDHPPPLSPGEKGSVYQELVAMVRWGDLEPAVQRGLAREIEDLPEYSDDYVEARNLLAAVDGSDDGIIAEESVEEVERMLVAARTPDSRDPGAAMSADEVALLEARLEQVRPRVRSDALVFADWGDASNVPWYLAVAGTPEGLWRWPVSAFVHVYWRDVLVCLGLLWSLGLIVEGLVGWRIHLPLVAFALVATSIVEWAATKDLGIVLPVYGMFSVNGFLIGVATVWCPANRIHYRIIPWAMTDDIEAPVWLVLFFGLILNALLLWLIGVPGWTLLLLSVVEPAIGLGVGYATLRLARVETEGWDLPALWATRDLTASQRNRRFRDQRLGITEPLPVAGATGKAWTQAIGGGPAAAGATQLPGPVPAGPAVREPANDLIEAPPDLFAEGAVARASAEALAPLDEARAQPMPPADGAPLFAGDPEPRPAGPPSAPSPAPAPGPTDDELFLPDPPTSRSFAVAGQTTTHRHRQGTARTPRRRPPNPVQVAAEEAIKADILAGRFLQAAARVHDALAQVPGWEPPFAIVDKLSKFLYQAQAWEDTLAIADLVLAHHPDRGDQIRLVAADVAILRLRQSGRGVAYLDGLVEARLKPKHQARAAYLRQRAQQLRDGGLA